MGVIGPDRKTHENEATKKWVLELVTYALQKEIDVYNECINSKVPVCNMDTDFKYIENVEQINEQIYNVGNIDDNPPKYTKLICFKCYDKLFGVVRSNNKNVYLADCIYLVYNGAKWHLWPGVYTEDSRPISLDLVNELLNPQYKKDFVQEEERTE
jgi:hypothetical protein